MKFCSCLVFAVFFLTAVLLIAISLRNADNCVFYKLCTVQSTKVQLKQQLWQRQLQWERLTNPAAVSKRLEP